MRSRLRLIPVAIAVCLVLGAVIFAPQLTRIHPRAWHFRFTPFPSDPPPNVSHKVWVDRRTGVYYCHGSKFYGKMRPGFSMNQGLALQKGYRPSEASPCP